MNTTCHCSTLAFKRRLFYLSRLNWGQCSVTKAVLPTFCLALDLPLNLASICHILKISKLTLHCYFHFKTNLTLHLESLKALLLIRCIAHIPQRLRPCTSGLSCLLCRCRLLLLLLLLLSFSHAVWLFQGSPGDTVLLSSLMDRHGQNESSPVLLTAQLCPPGGLAGRISVTAGCIGLCWLWQCSSLLIH